jgi:CheY-like chemotaxis protein
MKANPRVLLVQGDGDDGEFVRRLLEDRGYDLTVCPGPSAPTYVCIGDRTGACPLIADSDVVVLDCRLRSEAVLEGTSAGDLLSLYLSSDRPVVAIEGDDLAGLYGDDDVEFLGADTEGGIVGAVERAIEYR